jgi:hypothetical protein
MDTNLMILVVAIVILAAVAGLIFWRMKKSQRLRVQFGPEYDRAVNQYHDRSRAEAELEEREKRVRQYDIRPLARDQRERYADSWRKTQARFVDEPDGAVRAAHDLVNEVMRSRGYPVSAEFDRNARDLSVEHPRVVEHYRVACEIAGRRDEGKASTEDLRKAMTSYRELFEELLGMRVSNEVRR